MSRYLVTVLSVLSVVLLVGAANMALAQTQDWNWFVGKGCDVYFNCTRMVGGYCQGRDTTDQATLYNASTGYPACQITTCLDYMCVGGVYTKVTQYRQGPFLYGCLCNVADFSAPPSITALRYKPDRVPGPDDACNEYEACTIPNSRLRFNTTDFTCSCYHPADQPFGGEFTPAVLSSTTRAPSSSTAVPTPDPLLPEVTPYTLNPVMFLRIINPNLPKALTDPLMAQYLDRLYCDALHGPLTVRRLTGADMFNHPNGMMYCGSESPLPPFCLQVERVDTERYVFRSNNCLPAQLEQMGGQ